MTTLAEICKTGTLDDVIVAVDNNTYDNNQIRDAVVAASRLSESSIYQLLMRKYSDQIQVMAYNLWLHAFTNGNFTLLADMDKLVRPTTIVKLIMAARASNATITWYIQHCINAGNVEMLYGHLCRNGITLDDARILSQYSINWSKLQDRIYVILELPVLALIVNHHNYQAPHRHRMDKIIFLAVDAGNLATLQYLWNHWNYVPGILNCDNLLAIAIYTNVEMMTWIWDSCNPPQSRQRAVPLLDSTAPPSPQQAIPQLLDSTAPPSRQRAVPCPAQVGVPQLLDVAAPPSYNLMRNNMGQHIFGLAAICAEKQLHRVSVPVLQWIFDHCDPHKDGYDEFRRYCYIHCNADQFAVIDAYFDAKKDETIMQNIFEYICKYGNPLHQIVIHAINAWPIMQTSLGQNGRYLSIINTSISSDNPQTRNNYRRHIIQIVDYMLSQISNSTTIEYRYAYQCIVHLIEMHGNGGGPVMVGFSQLLTDLAASARYQSDVYLFAGSTRNISFGVIVADVNHQVDANLVRRYNLISHPIPNTSYLFYSNVINIDTREKITALLLDKSRKSARA